MIHPHPVFVTLFHVPHLDEVLGNLHGVEGGALAYLVAGEPQRAAVVVGQVLAYAAHIHVVLARALQGHGIDVLVVGVIDQGHAGGLGQRIAYLLNAERPLGLEPDALGMAAQRADTHAGGRRAYVGM